MAGVALTALVIFSVVGRISTASTCQDKLPDCVEYGAYACKGQYEAWGRANCEQYCGHCGNSTSIPTPTKSACHDTLSDCAEYGKQACVGVYVSWAKRNCPDYCGYCPSSSSACHDKLMDCDEYGHSACTGIYAGWAKLNCPKFCNLCGTTTVAKTTHVTTKPSITGCYYKGQKFSEGSVWQDGCAYNCTCLRNGSGYYQCTDLCPRFLNLPPGCSYVKVDGQCCEKLKCNDSSVTIDGQSCVYKGQTYNTGDTWVDGCLYNCTCIDASRGHYQCRDICPTYENIPQECKMVKKPGECCPEVICSKNVTVITNSSIISTGNRTIKCAYKGKLYNQGETWEDGCDYTCTCRTERGYYTCHSKCVTWNLPAECKLNDPAPGKCCKTPSCPTGYVISYPPGYKEV